MRKVLILSAALLLAVDQQASAVVVTQWNFNSTTPDANTATGVTTPSMGTGTVANIGGTTATFATGSLGDPTSAGTDNSGWNLTTYPAQGAANQTAGLQANASTVGYTDITLSLDFRESGTTSRFWQLLVSSDGTNFSAPSGGVASFGAINNNTNVAFTSAGLYQHTAASGSQGFVQSVSYTFASGSVYENNPNFKFRWVSTFAPSTSTYISSNAGTSAAYSTSGTSRFDMVTIDGAVINSIPEPSAYLFGAVATLLAGGGVYRRRFCA